MGMTIDKSTEVLADYIDTYKVCGGNGYNPATNITQEACETFEMAVETMRKYQKIEQILDDCDLEAWEILEKIKEVTDEAYQIMYEGGEIFTKDDVVDMLKDLKKEMALLKFVGKCQDVVQQKIDALKMN